MATGQSPLPVISSISTLEFADIAFCVDSEEQRAVGI